jgi:hypothetical protein
VQESQEQKQNGKYDRCCERRMVSVIFKSRDVVRHYYDTRVFRRRINREAEMKNLSKGTCCIHKMLGVLRSCLGEATLISGPRYGCVSIFLLSWAVQVQASSAGMRKTRKLSGSISTSNTHQRKFRIRPVSRNPSGLGLCKGIRRISLQLLLG